jgi:hypothetical protein
VRGMPAYVLRSEAGAHQRVPGLRDFEQEGTQNRGEEPVITEIGITAGDIWHYLDAHGPGTLSRLVRDLDKPRELVLMSVGWLAREGHVILTSEGKDHRVALRKGS